MLKAVQAQLPSQIRVETLPLSMIRPNPYQPRKIFKKEALNDLAQSLIQHGLLQPICVRQVGDNYELIAGERRFRAAHLAGFSEINAVVYNAADQDSALLALVENIQREDLHFFEEAEGYLNLIRDYGCTQEQLAARLGKNQSTVANKLRILKLPKAVKEQIYASQLTERHARALLRLHNEQEQLRLIRIINEQNMSVKRTEQLVEKTLQRMFGEQVTRQRSKQNVLFLMRDINIYVNTVKKAIDTIRDAGGDVNMDVQYGDERVAINILIAK